MLSSSCKNTAGHVMTMMLIGINCCVFLGQYLATQYYPMVNLPLMFGMTPTKVIAALANGSLTEKIMAVATLLTTTVLHKNYLHLVTNMVILALAGRAVEAHLGKLRFLVFYLAGGLSASVVQILLAPQAAVPYIGASGAVLSVLGGHMVLLWLEREHWAVSSLEVLVYLSYLAGQLQAMYNKVPNVGWAAHVGGLASGFVLAGLWLTYGRLCSGAWQLWAAPPPLPVPPPATPEALIEVTCP